MSFLESFREEIVINEETKESIRHKAYKMDGKCADKDMRKLAKLGSSHCCDYFLPTSRAAIIIEVTDLLWKEIEHRGTYSYVTDKHNNELELLVRYLMRSEIQLKFYSTMLTLCRISGDHQNIREYLQGKNYELWIIDNQSVHKEEDVLWRSIRPGQGIFTQNTVNKDIKSAVTDVIGRTILDKVDILTPKILMETFPQNIEIL